MKEKNKEMEKRKKKNRNRIYLNIKTKFCFQICIYNRDKITIKNSKKNKIK